MLPLLNWMPPHTIIIALGLSTVISIGSLVLAPIAIARLPADYFVEDKPPRPRIRRSAHQRLFRLAFAALKNAIGVSLIIAGAAMFVLPGQGLLTMAVGLGLLDFPGKHHLVNAIVHRPMVLRTLNWVRSKTGAPPFEVSAAS
jgi:hypothetical protein